MSRHPPFKQTEAARPPWDTSASLTYCQTAKPDWQPGSGANDLMSAYNGKEVEIDPKAPLKEGASLYKMIISAVTPRPIAFVSTVNTEGAINVAPFSYFNLACSDPPSVMISISHVHPPALKETAQNILDTKEFNVSIISEHWIEASNYASIDCPPGTNEFALAGLTPLKNKFIKPPRVGESLFNMECVLTHHHHIPSASNPGTIASTVIIGEIKLFHVAEDIIDQDTLIVDTTKLAPVARLGGIRYGRITDMYELERPSWKKDEGKEVVQEALKKGQ
ncbi:Flavin reductase-like, FMN-binding domain containing protein [Pseudohyphozyma bogoriensis]|nr:Flavin reductase-like, FMN-binding domain containing protein [Pseudohyphozyma bogoriensis]